MVILSLRKADIVTKKFYISGIAAAFLVFTALLLAKDINQATYAGLSVALLIAFCLAFFDGRVKEADFKKLVIRLYKKSEEAAVSDTLVVDIAKILAKLSEQSTGSGEQRKEREAMIDELLRKARAKKKQREQILADAELVTRLMSTEDGPEADKIRAEITERGLF